MKYCVVYNTDKDLCYKNFPGFKKLDFFFNELYFCDI